MEPATNDLEPTMTTDFPAVTDGTIRLPNLLGHPNRRAWAKGDIVEIHAEYYRVAKVTLGRFGDFVTFALTPATAEQFAARTIRIPTLGGTSEATAALQIGNVHAHAAGNVLIKKVIAKTFQGAAGTGTIYSLEGVLVDDAKAAKAKAKWDAAAKVRTEAAAARVAAAYRNA